MKFERWLDTFVDEKGFDLEYRFDVKGQSGDNSIPLGCVVDAIKKAWLLFGIMNPSRFDKLKGMPQGLKSMKKIKTPAGQMNMNRPSRTIRV